MWQRLTSDLKLVVIFALLVGVVFAAFVSLDPRAAADLPYAYPPLFEEKLISLPQTWSTKGTEGLGYFAAAGLWSWPMDTIVLFLGQAWGWPFSLIVRLVFLLPIITISFVGCHRLLGYYELSPGSKLVGSLFYILNSYVLLLIDGGQLSVALAYATFPLAFYFFRQRATGKFVLTAIWLSVVDLRFLIIFGGVAFLDFVFGIRNWKNYLQLAVLAGLVLMGLHAYWLLPTVVFRQTGLPSSFSGVEQLDFLSFTTVSHALAFFQPHWPLNVFGQVALVKPEWFVLTLLVLIVPLVYLHQKTIAFWLVVAVVGIALVKGINPPAGEIYRWLFTHVPGFFVFRDPSKFFVVLALAYTVLLGHLVHRWRLLAAVVSVYLLLLVWPVYSGLMTGLFSTVPRLTQYQQLAKRLEADPSFGRVLWLPYFPPMGFTSNNHPSLDGLTLAAKRPFATARVGRYEVYNFLREAAYVDQLFAAAAIKYIVYSPIDPRRDPIEPDNLRYYHTFLSQLSQLPWLDAAATTSAIPYLQARQDTPHFRLLSGPKFVLGSDHDFYRRHQDFSCRAVVFAEEYPGLLKRVYDLPQAEIITGDKTDTDAAAAFLDAPKFIFLSRLLSDSPDSSGWWKRDTDQLVNWRWFLQQKYGLDNTDFDYGGGWAVAEGMARLTISDPRLSPNHILLARVMSSSRSGEMVFLQDGRAVGRLTSKSAGSSTDFFWHEIGRLMSNSSVEIVANGEINVVNVLAVVPRREWELIKQRWEDLRKRGNVATDLSRPDSCPAAVINTQRLSSTAYRIAISGLSQPAVLSFAQNYNPAWNLDSWPSLPVYSLVNGFVVDKNGPVDLNFGPQVYVWPGMIISLTTVILLASLWIFKRF